MLPLASFSFILRASLLKRAFMQDVCVWVIFNFDERMCENQVNTKFQIEKPIWKYNHKITHFNVFHKMKGHVKYLRPFKMNADDVTTANG